MFVEREAKLCCCTNCCTKRAQEPPKTPKIALQRSLISQQHTQDWVLYESAALPTELRRLLFDSKCARPNRKAALVFIP